MLNIIPLSRIAIFFSGSSNQILWFQFMGFGSDRNTYRLTKWSPALFWKGEKKNEEEEELYL